MAVSSFVGGGGECRGCVVLCGGGRGEGGGYDLPGSVVSPVDAAFVW